MSDDDQAPEEEAEEEAAWLATFADLMSLLMCFFVLLLSFSEMDIQKYRAIAGSMSAAFGVQRKFEAPSPPKGTSVIAQEFSPGIPQPSQINLMQSVDSDDSPVEKVRRQQLRSMSALSAALRPEINRNLVQVNRINGEIVVRIQESESFKSGSAALRPTLYPILDRIVEALENTSGRLVVGGHTDDVPISTTTYPSNWVLSSARAANVVHHLATSNQLGSKQVEIRAYGDSRPLVDNNTAENRAANRRVEIIISPESPLADLRAAMTQPVDDNPESQGDESSAVEPTVINDDTVLQNPGDNAEATVGQ